MEYSLYISCEVHVLYLAHHVYWETIKRTLRIWSFSPLKIILCSIYWHRNSPVNIQSYSYSFNFWFMIFISLNKQCDCVLCLFFFSLLSLQVHLNINIVHIFIGYTVFHCSITILWFAELFLACRAFRLVPIFLYCK